MLEEELRWELGLDLTPRYLGDDQVLLTGMNEVAAERIMNGGMHYSGLIVHAL